MFLVIECQCVIVSVFVCGCVEMFCSFSGLLHRLFCILFDLSTNFCVCLNGAFQLFDVWNNFFMREVTEFYSGLSYFKSD